MDENQEEVVYSFVGDVSSLREATQQAISMLGKYDAAMQKAASKDTFKASKTSTTNFQRVVGGIIKQVNTLTTSLNSVGDDLQKSIPNGAEVVASATSDLADVLNYLDSSSTIVSDDMRFLTGVLKETKAGLEAVTSRAQILSSSLKPLEQLNAAPEIEETNKAVAASVKHYEAAAAAGFKVQDAYVASGKSAAESAMAFLKAERAATKMTSVQAVMQRMRTELNMFGAYASKAWKQFSDHIAPVTTKLQSFKDKAATILDRVKSLLSQVGSAFRRTSQEADGEGDSFSQLTTRTGKLSSMLGKLSGLVSTNTHKFTGLSKVTRALKTALNGLLGLSLGRWLSNAANESIRFTENLNLFTVAMGDAYGQGLDFVNQMQELYGMDPSNLMRYAGNFYQLADAIQMPDQAAANLSLGLTKATNDIASLFNVDVETVFENLSSGMQGMSRAVRKYGMDIRTVTLQTTAASLGITAQVESMSEANRQGLRFITMMQQAANATGDFARTIETPANQLRIFKEQMSQLGRAIGDLFIGPLGKALQYINGFVMALRTAIQFVGTLLGAVNSLASDGSGAYELSDIVEDIGDEADTTTKKLKKMLAPFDELTILQSKDDSDGLSDFGSLDPRIEEAIANMQWSLEDVRMKANEVRDALLTFFGFTIDAGKIISWDSGTFEQNLLERFPEWTNTIQAAFANWTAIVNGFKAVFVSLGEVVSAVWDKVVGLLSKFVADDSAAKRIESLSTNLEKLASIISNNKDAIADFAIGFTAVSAALKGLTSIAALVQPISQVVSALGGVTPALLKTLGIIGLVVAAIALLYKNSTKFASSFRNLLSGVTGGITKLVQTALSVLSKVWDGIKTLWANNIQPTLTAVGDALAPVLDTVASLFGNVVDILVNVFNIIAELWTSTLQPVLAALFDAITGIATMFEQLWSATVGPILEYIGNGLSELWESTLGPIVQRVIEIVGALIEVILALWNNVLAPLLGWLLESLGPSIKMIFETAWDIISTVIQSIGSIISGLLTMLKGLLDFLAGVFTGDWERAWKGLVNILVGVGNAIIGIFELCVNAVISIINGLISVIYSAIVGLINMITGAVEGIAEILGYDLELTITAAPPQIPALSIPKIPEVALARGAVVTGPTTALIGEGRYDEAVIPLGNSPQMNEFADNVASRVNSGEQIALLREQNELLRQILDKTGVSLDGRSLDDALSGHQRNRLRGRGV